MDLAAAMSIKQLLVLPLLSISSFLLQFFFSLGVLQNFNLHSLLFKLPRIWPKGRKYSLRIQRHYSHLLYSYLIERTVCSWSSMKQNETLFRKSNEFLFRNTAIAYR
jgi:hypothetical protein